MSIAPSIKSRLLILISISVLFWLVCSLFLVDRINQIISFDKARQEISRLQNDAALFRLDAENLFNTFKQIAPGSSSGVNNDRFEEISIQAASSLVLLNSDKQVSGNLILKRNLKDADDNIQELKKKTSEFVGLFYERGDLGSGLIRQWKSSLDEMLNIPRSSLPQKSMDFISKIEDLSADFLINRNSDDLLKIIDLWQLERNLSLPENAINSENETRFSSFIEKTKSLAALYRKAGNNESTGLQAEIRFSILRLSDICQTLENQSEELYTTFSRKILRNFVLLIIVLGGAIMALFIVGLSKSDRSLSALRNFLTELSSGKIPDRLILSSGSEFNEMAERLNAHVESLNRKIVFADQIGEDDIKADFQPDGADDVLGNSLLKMANRLREAEEEEITHKKENEIRRWLSEGMASFGEIFRSERENLDELSFKVIKNLVKYINAAQGALYLNNTEEEPAVIDLVSAFAFDRRKYFDRRIHYGEGLIGTCALEMEPIYLTEIPADYLEIGSGIGEAKPASLLIVPLKLENELFGILEIASFNKLEDYERGFVEQLGESIATTLASVRINEKTVRLLEKSQKQAEEMARQEEKMLQNMQELKNAQEESMKKETEITGILNAVNSSSLVAEYSTSGRFSDINEKFLFLLDSPREQIIGKHHSDLSAVDKYSAEYKEFWKRLRDGETISQVELFRLFNGNEIWLNQTYTPILDRNGRPYKILNIAHDITQSRKQEESLLNQANEIKRRGLDLESLSNSVDTAIIKCELSNDGIVMDANENYIEITGYTRKEILGKNIRVFLKDSEKQQFEKIWEEILREKTYNGVIRRTKPTGEEIWLMATFTPVKDEDGDIYKAYFLAQDITEKKLKYQLLEDANKEIDRLRKLLNDPENT